MRLTRALLWVDGLAALTAGLLMLPLIDWLSALYQLPPAFLRNLASVNLGYALLGLSLARRRHRPLRRIQLLSAANLVWALACAALAWQWRSTASPFGLAHLLIEAGFVATLGMLEWRRRFALLHA